MRAFTKRAALIAMGLSLMACAPKKPYEPIVDGPKGAGYDSDLADCRDISKTKKATGAGAATGAFTGGITAGAYGGSTGDVAASIALGGLVGSAKEKAKARSARDRLVFHCMRGRGHNVIG